MHPVLYEAVEWVYDLVECLFFISVDWLSGGLFYSHSDTFTYTKLNNNMQGQIHRWHTTQASDCNRVE